MDSISQAGLPALGLMGVYAITHTATGRQYIGSSATLRKRLQQHRRDLLKQCHDNCKLQRAWNKYGPDAFAFRVLDYVETCDDLVPAEQQWMDALRPHFNILPRAGSGRLGLPHTLQTRQKISAGNAGRNSRIGTHHSAATRAKMSASAKGRSQSDAMRRKISALHKGRTLTPEHRAKIGAGGKGRVVTKENLEKRRATRAQPGYAEQLSSNLRRAWATYRAPAALAVKAGWPADVEAISIKEAAALLGCACATIRVHIHDGSLPATPVGKFWIIRRTDLDAVAPALCARFDRFPERKNKNRPRLWIAHGTDEGALPKTQAEGANPVLP